MQKQLMQRQINLIWKTYYLFCLWRGDRWKELRTTCVRKLIRDGIE